MCLIMAESNYGDAALDLGINHTRGLQVLSRLMSDYGHGVKPCPIHDEPGPHTSLLEHVLEKKSRETLV